MATWQAVVVMVRVPRGKQGHRHVPNCGGSASPAHQHCGKATARGSWDVLPVAPGPGDGRVAQHWSPGPAPSASGWGDTTHREVNLAAAHDVVQEGVDPVDLPEGSVSAGPAPQQLGTAQHSMAWFGMQVLTFRSSSTTTPEFL